MRHNTFIAVLTVFALLLILLGAAMHEADLANNFAKTGDAKAWFFEIKR